MARAADVQRQQRSRGRIGSAAAVLSALLWGALAFLQPLAAEEPDPLPESPVPQETGPKTVIMQYEVEFFDLDAGEVCFEEFGCPGGGLPDLYFAFNAPKPNPAVLAFFPFVHGIGLVMPDMPFDAIGPAYLDLGLELDRVAPDLPFGPNASALVQTTEGSVFRLGHARCLTRQASQPTYPDCLAIPNDGLVIDGRHLANGMIFRYEKIGTLP